jgi:hypothetical protein
VNPGLKTDTIGSKDDGDRTWPALSRSGDSNLVNTATSHQESECGNQEFYSCVNVLDSRYQDTGNGPCAKAKVLASSVRPNVILRPKFRKLVSQEVESAPFHVGILIDEHSRLLSCLRSGTSCRVFW